MGNFFYPITIIGPAGEQTLEALVDTGELFAVIPASVFLRLGIEPQNQRRSGEPMVQVKATLNGSEGWVMCVFGRDDESPRIGRHTLDSFIFDIDEQGRLVPKVLHEIRHF
jgi:hypothetical protein